MVYQAFACETVTGKNIGPLDVTVKSWHRELNGTDTASVLLSAGALTAATRDRYRLLTEPDRMALVIEWVNPGDLIGTPVFAGPFLNRPFDGSSVTLNAQGYRQAILGARKIVSWTPPYASQKISFSNMSLGSVGVSVVQYVTAAGKPGATLPIVFPAIESDSDTTHYRDYWGFNLTNADSALTELTGVINGPDFDFVPTWTDGNRSAIQLVMRAGTNGQPKLQSPNFVSFDATQPASGVKKLGYVDDGAKLTTRQWGNGSGSDVDTLMSTGTSSTLVNAGYPVLERQTDYKSDVNQSTLDAAVQGDLAAASAPLVQWTLEVDGSAPPLLGTYLLGDVAQVNVLNHLWVPDGDYPMRVVAADGDASTTVKLTVQGVNA